MQYNYKRAKPNTTERTCT